MGDSGGVAFFLDDGRCRTVNDGILSSVSWHCHRLNTVIGFKTWSSTSQPCHRMTMWIKLKMGQDHVFCPLVLLTHPKPWAGSRFPSSKRMCYLVIPRESALHWYLPGIAENLIIQISECFVICSESVQFLQHLHHSTAIWRPKA